MSLNLVDALRQSEPPPDYNSNRNSQLDPEKNPSSSNVFESDPEAGNDRRDSKAAHGVFDNHTSRQDSVNHDIAEGTAEEVARTKELQRHRGLLRWMRKGEEWLDSKMGIELQGIDRVPEEAKRPPSIWNIFLLWWSLNVHVGVIPLGVLGPEFGLSFGQTVGACIVGNLLGSLCTAYDGTLGPKVSAQHAYIGSQTGFNTSVRIVFSCQSKR